MNDEIQLFLDYFFKDFSTYLNDPANVTHKVILSAMIIVITIGLLKVSKWMIYRGIENAKFSTMVYKALQAFISMIAILLLFSVWMRVQKSILLILFIFAIVTALSIKNLSNNLVAWFMLIRKKYFKLYDRIEVQGIKGDVIKITPFYFKIVERGNQLSSSTATGRVLHIPNHILLDNMVYNYSNFIDVNWGEVKYFITVDSDWKRAKKIIETACEQYVNDFLKDYTEEEIHKIDKKLSLVDEKAKLKTYVLIDDTQITIVAQYPIHYTKGASTESMLNERIIPQLQEAPDVELSGVYVHVQLDNDIVVKKQSK